MYRFNLQFNHGEIGNLSLAMRLWSAKIEFRRDIPRQRKLLEAVITKSHEGSAIFLG